MKWKRHGKVRAILSVAQDRLHTQCHRILCYFAFTKSDRRAIAVLLALIAGTILLRARGVVRPAKEWDLAKYEACIADRPNIAASRNETGKSNSPYPNDRNRSDSGLTAVRYTPPAYMVKKKFSVDLNRADTFDLQEIRGIGPAYARRIVSYREKIGGFVRIDQLREVWGIDSLLFTRIVPSVRLDNPRPRKILLNRVDIRTLKAHPYLDYYQAKEIYLHRQKYGPFTKVEDLKKVNLIDSGTFARIAPYVATGSDLADEPQPDTVHRNDTSGDGGDGTPISVGKAQSDTGRTAAGESGSQNL